MKQPVVVGVEEPRGHAVALALIQFHGNLEDVEAEDLDLVAGVVFANGGRGAGAVAMRSRILLSVFHATIRSKRSFSAELLRTDSKSGSERATGLYHSLLWIAACRFPNASSFVPKPKTQ